MVVISADQLADRRPAPVPRLCSIRPRRVSVHEELMGCTDILLATKCLSVRGSINHAQESRPPAGVEVGLLGFSFTPERRVRLFTPFPAFPILVSTDDRSGVEIGCSWVTKVGTAVGTEGEL